MLKKNSLLYFVAVCLIAGMATDSLRAGVRPGTRSRTRKSLQGAQGMRTLAGQALTLLPTGQWLLAGGEGPNGPVDSISIRDPRSGSVTQIDGKMIHPRAWHTATLLPDGTVLIFGGVGENGKLVDAAEIYDPTMQRSQTVPIANLLVRAHHSATLLTDGRVLIAGGVDEEGVVTGSLQLLDSGTGAVQTGATTLLTARQDHTAILEADGTVLLWGGTSAHGAPLNYGEIFDPNSLSLRIQASLVQPSADNQPPQVMESIPENNAADVSSSILISLRFSKPLQVGTVNASTTTLRSSQGDVQARIVPAEGGMLAFISPNAALDAGTFYTLSLTGLTDKSGQALPETQISFTTAASSSDTGASSGGAGIVGTPGGSGSDPFDSSSRKLPPLRAKPGETALSGQVLKLDGEPLAEVTFQIAGSKSTMRSDRTGRFLLTDFTAGHIVLSIDGTTANTQKETYGYFEVGVDIIAGQTNVLSYTIWMPVLDMEHAVTIPSTTQSEVVVTTPLIPGLELHIPPQSSIIDRHGNPVTKISITPVPLKQPPFPLPGGVVVPVYFTIQPGGAYIKVQNPSGPQGAQLFYPNTFHSPARTLFNFWDYNADSKGWFVYGHGKVSADLSQVVPDPGTVIYEFSGAMVSNPASNAPPPASPGGKPGGDPVDLATGLLIHSKTDLVLSDVIPIALTRTYRQSDSVSRAFGIGASHPYDMFLVGDNVTSPEGYTYQDLILADGGRIHFSRTTPCVTSDGSCSNSAIFTSFSPTSFYGATLQFFTTIWKLTKKDGTVYTFPDSTASTVSQSAAVIGMQDRFGNSLTFTRDNNSNLTQITSPNGRWIKFTYDTSNRITQAQDIIGRTVNYTYDPGGRLSTVTDANGGTWTYTYDPANNMLTIQDARQIVYLTNQFDANNRVIKQTQADNGIYQFAYTLDADGNVTQTNVTAPNGNVEQVAFNSDGYVTSDTYALGKTEQQTITYNRQPVSDLLLSMTDALGRQTSYTYDPMGNVMGITRLAGTPNAVTTTLAYEPVFNQLTAITDPLGHTTSLNYDGSGNLITVVDPLGNLSELTYNSAGQPVSVTDSLGNTTQFAYDLGDLVQITDPLARTVNRFVDSAGRLISVTDPAGQLTQIAYNPLNQISSTTDPKGNKTNFAYDPNGNLSSVTDANNHATQYTYDNMDRLATRKDPLLNQESYQYDGNGNLTQFTDRRGKVTTYTYDGLNRMAFAGFGTQAGPTYESTVNYTYDAGNRLTKTVDSIAGTITRGYDDRFDALTSDATPQGTVGVSYDAAGRRANLTVSGQAVANYTFDAANRLRQIVQGSATVQLGYDADNRRTTLTLPNGIVVSYNYDNASQLAGLTYSLGSATLGNLSYSYDTLERRASLGGSFARTGLPLAITATAYNANNQLTTWGTANLFYDLNGNMTSDGTHSYTWDARNHLSQIDSGNTASFFYDPLGRRTSKSVLGTTTNFLYDGANAVKEVIGGTNTANSLSGGIDEVFQRTDSAGARSFLTDALGSTVALADSSGTLQTQYTFEPFGNTTLSGSSTTNSFAYTGRELDAGNLYFYRARYYSSTLQRFVSEDPIRFNGGVNFYAYANESPTSLIDPLGLFAMGGRNCGNKAANNGRNCTTGSASKLQYVAASAEVSAMTAEFFSGLGPGNLTFDPNSATSQVMAQSGPVQEVLNSYYMTGQTSGLYTFGLPGLVSAGGNPVAQFVGSFRWSITPGSDGINLSLTNTTSFRSLTYDVGPQWQRGSWPTPMGNTHQTYKITATCH